MTSSTQDVCMVCHVSGTNTDVKPRELQWHYRPKPKYNEQPKFCVMEVLMCGSCDYFAKKCQISGQDEWDAIDFLVESYESEPSDDGVIDYFSSAIMDMLAAEFTSQAAQSCAIDALRRVVHQAEYNQRNGREYTDEEIDNLGFAALEGIMDDS